MFAILTKTDVGCDDCGGGAVYVMVNLPDAGFVACLCPLHLASFVGAWMVCPERAINGLKHKRDVKPDQ